MLETMETILAGFEGGRLTRRQAAQHLAMAAFGLAAAAGTAGAQPAPAASPATPLFEVDGLNHIALHVKDVARSRDFYVKTLGLTVLRDMSPRLCFLAMGDHYLAIFQNDQPKVDHFCFNLPNHDVDATQAKLEAAGLQPYREENRVYFRDPDGLVVQIAGPWDTWPGPRPRR